MDSALSREKDAGAMTGAGQQERDAAGCSASDCESGVGLGQQWPSPDFGVIAEHAMPELPPHAASVQ